MRLGPLPLLPLLSFIIGGARSEFFRGTCATSPCGVGGRCIQAGDTAFFCSCEAGYFGGRCEIQQCDPNVCENGGKCVKGGRLPLPGNFHCECPNGFTGPSCSEVAPSTCSETRPCGPHGKCRMIGEHEKDDTGRDFECDCEEGWSGPDCRIEQPSCGDHRHCRNGGRCINLAGVYSCKCREGFEGPNCEVQSDICARDSPCRNGGTCTNTDPGSFHCSCARGFGGARCEISLAFSPSSCSPRLDSAYACLNGGKCTANGCVCPSGWRGRHCERDVHECDLNPCRNGGECIDQDGSFLCLCPPYYEGARCEKRITGGCDAHQCSTGSTCLDSGNDYICLCPDGMNGRYCTEPILCDGVPCVHGNCHSDGDRETCDCEQGWNGTSCNVDIDECAYAPCAAGAQCLNSEGAFSCICPPGTTGLLCQTTIVDCAEDDPMCGLDFDACKDVECPMGSSCKADRTRLKGFFCESNEKKVDACEGTVCHNGGNCTQSAIGTICRCRQPFYGERCEHLRDPCDGSSCANGGLCKPLPDLSGFSCECPAGFSGRNCTHNDDECEEGLCLNGARCIDGINDFRCECGREFSGKHCEKRVDTGVYNGTDEVDKASCLRSNCASKASNGICDRECNHFACGWDGGDCSARQKTPFESCPDASYCAHAFGNGVCDEICNNQECLFDGSDCRRSAKDCPQSRRLFCLEHYLDGVCDPACNEERCGWDGGDCETPEEKAGDGTMEVSIIILAERAIFEERVDEFLLTLAEHLRASVKIKNADSGLPEAFEWSLAGGKGDRILAGHGQPLQAQFHPRPRRDVDTSLKGIMITLQIDSTQCVRECFSDAAAVAAFLGAATAKKVLSSLSMPLYEASALRDMGENNGGSAEPGWMVLLGVLGVVAVMGVGVLAKKIVGGMGDETRKRKCVDAPTWTPPVKEVYNNQPGSAYTSNTSLYFPYKSLNDVRAKPVFKSNRPPTPEPARSPLAEYCLNGKIPDNMVLSQEAVNEATFYDRTPLHFLMLAHNKPTADKLADLQRLYDAGADLDARDKDDNTPLHYACKSISVSAVRRLLALGANPCLQNEKGETPLHVSACLGDDLLIDILCKEESVKEKIDMVDDADQSALMVYAARSPATIDGAKILIASGADINFTGEKCAPASYRGRTPLHAAAEFNTTNERMIPFLIQANANRDAQDCEDKTALWCAVDANNMLAVEALIAAGASQDFADHNDRTPWARAAEKNNTAMKDRLAVARSTLIPSMVGYGNLRNTPILPRPPPPPPSTKPPPGPPRKKVKPAHSPSTPPASSSTSGYSTTPSPPQTKTTLAASGGSGGVLPSHSAHPQPAITSVLDSPNSDTHLHDYGHTMPSSWCGPQPPSISPPYDGDYAQPMAKPGPPRYQPPPLSQVYPHHQHQPIQQEYSLTPFTPQGYGNQGGTQDFNYSLYGTYSVPNNGYTQY